jgi:hypothetical protein
MTGVWKTTAADIKAAMIFFKISFSRGVAMSENDAEDTRPR